MMSASLPDSEQRARARDDLNIASVNAPGLAAASAPQEALDNAHGSRMPEALPAEPGNRVAAWRGDRRLEQAFLPVPLADTAEVPVFRDGSACLITGGFGGIGPTVAAELPQRHGANGILPGRDPPPPRAVWAEFLHGHGPADRTVRGIRVIQAFEDPGGPVTTAGADACNTGRTRAVGETTSDRFGSIAGVIPKAGRMQNGPFLARTAVDMDAVFAPTITGLLVRDTFFPDAAPENLVPFSSICIATRTAGRVDHVAANARLSAYAQARGKDATRVCALNSSVWTGVGILTEGMAERLDGRSVPRPEPAGTPPIDATGIATRGNQLSRARHATKKRWMQGKHPVAPSEALKPGAGCVDATGEALCTIGARGVFETRDLYFFWSFQFANDRDVRLGPRLGTDPEGSNLTMHSTNAGAEGYQLARQAALVPRAEGAEPPAPDLTGIAARFPLLERGRGTVRLIGPQGAHLDLGPPWHVQQSTGLGDAQGVAARRLPASLSDGPGHDCLLHPGPMAPASGRAIPLVPGNCGRRLRMPVSCRSIRFHAPLPSETCGWMRRNPGDTPAGGFASLDVTLTDLLDQGCVAAEGRQMQRMRESLKPGATALPDAETAAPGQAPRGICVPLSPGNVRLHNAISQGMRRDTRPQGLFHLALYLHWRAPGGRCVSASREDVCTETGRTVWAPRTPVAEMRGDHHSVVLAPNVGVPAKRLRHRSDLTEARAGDAPVPSQRRIGATAAG